jgi:ABC-type Zn uptake system ZnuABC Zn-binding protein ZnuA
MRALALLAMLALIAAAGAAEGADRLRVVTTIPDLKALAEAVGGDLVEVDSLTRGTQNVHEAEVRPSMMVKLRRADVLVENGLDLDAWIDVAVQGANNGALVRGAPGRIDVSRNVPVLDVPAGRVDRSMGDVHPRGNPHVTLDPGLAPILTGNIADGLARIAPQHRATFDRNRQAFLARLESEMARWADALHPAKGSPVVTYHSTFAYFLARFGLRSAGTVEDRPGIPPSPGHLARLIQHMRAARVKVIVVEPWSDRKLAERIAGEAGARAVVLASASGTTKGADGYLGAIDHNVRALAEALR